GVEIVDVARRAVVGTVRLSTSRRPVRILGVAASPGGERLYLLGRGVEFEVDRYLIDSEVEIFVYDVSTGEVTSTFPLPESVGYSTFPELRMSPEGDVLFAMGDDIYEIGLDSHVVESVISLSRQRAPGYGAPGGGLLFYENDPGIYYAAYQTRDPVLDRGTTGVLRLDLGNRQLFGFDLGPGMNVAHIALSPDGRTAYLGGMDLVAVDMRSHRILKRKEGIERGRTNTSWIVSGDGTKLYVSGVGAGMKIYDTASLELIEEISFGADVLFAPIVLPRDLLVPVSE
ncbi:MAG TPA: hypothetical protein VEK15_05775, partial [Vicinamibacteria bacterium]|nr:hypothetical protein [Vicinamibacteria bacterium]